jgi:hypothetical protein
MSRTLVYRPGKRSILGIFLDSPIREYIRRRERMRVRMHWTQRSCPLLLVWHSAGCTLLDFLHSSPLSLLWIGGVAHSIANCLNEQLPLLYFPYISWIRGPAKSAFFFRTGQINHCLKVIYAHLPQLTKKKKERRRRLDYPWTIVFVDFVRTDPPKAI